MKNDNESIEKNVMQFFASLADKTRLHILLSIAEKPKTVNEIYDFVGREKMTLSAISHQLKTLNDLSIVTQEKKVKKDIMNYQISSAGAY